MQFQLSRHHYRLQQLAFNLLHADDDRREDQCGHRTVGHQRLAYAVVRPSPAHQARVAEWKAMSDAETASAG